MSPTGVEMSRTYKTCRMVRARLRVLVGRARAACRSGGALRRDGGMVTSEYAMGIIAAVAFAVVLYKVVTSGAVGAELERVVRQALDARM
ncbi:hypothetical protein GCM10010259_17730 [Streptomyces daghestanicus]|uniref:DUF4244 domain-containing protein n=2 Tax=Streptomyces daghestanicus TaxID=66885 RepID=A0ABQ3Q3K9_9ACTN|nr:hypothetical protein GCM10010259_17730 [Streptomyces daghestanicus]GHI31836.1 hypothetical protein Sdagh_35660 [Streptomyces daghestanicus]